MDRMRLAAVAAAIALVTSGCPGPDGVYEYETATLSLTGMVEPSEQVGIRALVEIDGADLRPFDTLILLLTMPESSPTSAVLGELIEVGPPSDGLEMMRIQDPRGPQNRYPLGRLQLDLDRCPSVGRCVFEIDAVIGNVGSNSEAWVLDATLQRDAPADRTIEIASFQMELVNERRAVDGWRVEGPLLLGGQPGEPVAYAVTLTTSVTDPSLFDLLIVEPRQNLVTRTMEAIIGPAGLQWALTYFEPSLTPLSSQAVCDDRSCRIDAVAIFRPAHEEDWWMAMVTPSNDPLNQLLPESEVTIDVRRLDIASFAGRIGQETTGSIGIELDASADTTHALVWWDIKPENIIGTAWAGQLGTTDGTLLGQYEWFELDCSDRCRRDLTLAWDIPAGSWDVEKAGELVYSGYVIGGTGSGVAVGTPPAVTVRESE